MLLGRGRGNYAAIHSKQQALSRKRSDQRTCEQRSELEAVFYSSREESRVWISLDLHCLHLYAMLADNHIQSQSMLCFFPFYFI